MRPVNLIPPEERRDAGAQLRSGPLAYLVLGALVALLLGVFLLVSAGNEVSSKSAELTELESETATAQAKAARLTPYTQLAAIHDRRVETVTALADSRFDWERVIRELSLILPGDVWLTNLTGTVRPDVAVNGAPSIALRDSTPGPALEILGCAAGQEAVAGFIADLRDIDGVTRVGVQSSKLGDSEEASGGSGSAPSGEAAEGESADISTCQTKNFIAEFEIVVAFDLTPANIGEGH